MGHNVRPVCRSAMCATCYLVAVFAGSAHAQTPFGLNVDIDFNFPGDPATGTPVSTYGGAGNQPGVWGTASFGTGPLALIGLDGQPSGVTMSRSAGPSLTVFGTNGPADYQKLIGDADSISADITYTFSGFPAGQYTIYTYAAAPNFTTIGTRITVTGGGGGPQTVAGAASDFSLAQGQTHSIHTISTAGGPIAIVVSKAAQSGVVNGFQFVPAPVAPPALTAVISDPSACAQISDGTVAIRGTASGPTFLSWTLQITGGPSPTWSTINSGTTPVVDGLLGTWATGVLTRPCGYTLRLLVNTTNGLTVEGLRSFYAGVPGDANLNGSVAFNDVTAVLSNFPTSP